MAGNVIIPAPEMGEIDRQLRPQYEIWRVEKEASQPVFVIDNVRHIHDPEWRERFWCIENVRSGKSLFWQGVGLLFFIADAGYYFVRSIR